MAIMEMSKSERDMFKKKAEQDFQKKVATFLENENATTKSIFKNVPERYKKRWIKSFFGELSALQSLKLKCFECAGFEDVQENVGDCRSRTCPIWNLRPLQKN